MRMSRDGGIFRILSAAGILALSATTLAAAPLAAQQRPADLTVLPPTPTDYTPQKTPWGDWDFSGIWPMDNIANSRILFQRPKGFGDRVWLTDEEHNKRITNAEGSDAGYSAENVGLQTQSGSVGLAEWTKTSNFSWRTSLLVSPQDGRIPPLTPAAEKLYRAGRSGWVPGQSWDWVDDFDTWDRCITQGIPASMFPNRYNHGIRIFQSPGYIVIMKEMLATRVIPIVKRSDLGRHWSEKVEAWMGDSRAHWDGKTLVIETTNIVSGDAVTHNVSKRSASPVIVTMIGGMPRNTIPMSTKARTLEKLTMTGADAILYEITYEDPEVFTAPWTAQIEWSRNQEYRFFEYACHEGNVQLRNYITASRAHRRDLASGAVKPDEVDPLALFAREEGFDFDPVAPGAPQSGPPAPPADGADASK
jgi:hypothetical protein